MQVRQAFQSRIQQEKEDWIQYLDALDGLRSQGFPQESITTKRYEILQRFMEGVSVQHKRVFVQHYQWKFNLKLNPKW